MAATGGSVENPRRISAKEAEMGLSFSSDLHEAFHGLEKFKGKPLTDLSAIGLVFFGVAHLITYEDSGIIFHSSSAIEDLPSAGSSST